MFMCVFACSMCVRVSVHVCECWCVCVCAWERVWMGVSVHVCVLSHAYFFNNEH